MGSIPPPPSLGEGGSLELWCDASHLGKASWATFQALWSHVRPSGIYVIEDWGTGYWGTWPDGSDYQPGTPPGHTAGMVGMVKRLADELDHGDVERLDVLPGIAFAFKRRVTDR